MLGSYEKFLLAVISLPAGVFQPYSGVKTSILLLDRQLAARSDSIAFFRVENDGFGLGAQRRAIDKNDLPAALIAINNYKLSIRNEEVGIRHENNPQWLIVPKVKIAVNGEYNLSGERYRDVNICITKYPQVSIGDIIIGKPQYGSGASKVPYDGKIRYIRIIDIMDIGELKIQDPVSPSIIEPENFLELDDLLIARSGSVGRTYLHCEKSGIYQYAGYLIRFRINPMIAVASYVYYITKSQSWYNWIYSNSKTGTLTNINAVQYSTFKFPLPPLEIQQAIVTEIEQYQEEIKNYELRIK